MHQRLIVGTMLVAVAMTPGGPAAAQHAMEGSWTGAIEIQGQRLPLVVHFTRAASGLSATVDIQGQTGLPLRNVSHEAPRVRFELPAGPGVAVFEGQVEGESMSGTFTQAGVAGTFTLARGPGEETAEAAAESVPYRQDEVTFSNGSVTLAGTLTRPASGGPHPAVVMITGSGAQNRDEELFGFKPFRVIADHFTRHGIAVLRYDDRGVGGSSGSTSQSTSSDFADDALAGVRFLKAQSDINAAQIGLVGHSEGGIVAPLAASRSPSVAFIVLMAGTAVTGEAILLEQGRLIAEANGATQADLERQRADQELSFAAIRTGQGWDVIEERVRTQTREAVEKMSAEERKSVADVDQYVETRVNASIASIRTPWFKYFLDYDPAPTLERVRVPVLALFGEVDLQVPPDQSRPPMERALKKGGNPDYTIRVFPKANHLFLTSETGSPTEYATMSKEFVPGFLNLMTTWIAERTGVTP